VPSISSRVSDSLVSGSGAFQNASCLDIRQSREERLTGAALCYVSRTLANTGRPEITALLAAWKEGEPASLDRLVALVYPELRRIARRQLRRWQPGESLESAALANEAYLRLVRAGGIGCEGRVHFFAVCAQLMRRILVDHARQRGAARRGGDVVRVPLEDVPLLAPAHCVEVLALDEALLALAAVDGRKSRVVELRYFGGLTIEETAAVLGVSLDTAKRDWRMARAWLLAELTRREPAAAAAPATPSAAGPAPATPARRR
jgi:RNA polymerase sigma factor (TIGR02999 family)